LKFIKKINKFLENFNYELDPGVLVLLRTIKKRSELNTKYYNTIFTNYLLGGTYKIDKIDKNGKISLKKTVGKQQYLLGGRNAKVIEIKKIKIHFHTKSLRNLALIKLKTHLDRNIYQNIKLYLNKNMIIYKYFVPNDISINDARWKHKLYVDYYINDNKNLKNWKQFPHIDITYNRVKCVHWSKKDLNDNKISNEFIQNLF